MKLFNSLVFSAAIVALLAFPSCTKEYTCQCTITYSGVAGLPDSSVREYPITDTKKNAKTACESKSETFEKDNIKTVETCVLF